MRLFIGIPLAAEVEGALDALCTRLRSRQPKHGALRWSSPEAWHITLQFLGSTGPEDCNCVISQLKLLQKAPLKIQLEPPGVFDRAGIVYAGVRLTPELLSLHRLVVDATSRCGFRPEDRPYRPHITLARSKGRNGLDRLRLPAVEDALPSFTARELLLYESFTEPQGSRYEVRGRFPLRRTGEVDNMV